MRPSVNLILIALFLFAAAANVTVFFTGGHDADKITIAALFVAITLHTAGDYFRAKERR